MTTDARVRLALVNDYELVVAGLTRMLEPFQERIEIVETAAGEPVTDRADVALYDAFAPHRPHPAAVQELMSNPLVGAVAIYTWNLDPRLVARCREQGVSGCLAKSLPAQDLVDAIIRIHRGEIVFPLDPTRDPAPSNGDWPGRASGLTDREAEVIAFITQGLSNAQIAERAYLSPNSVKSFIRSAYRKMEVASRSQAVLWGVRHGMAPDD